MKKKLLIVGLVVVAVAVVVTVSLKRGSSNKGIPVTLAEVKTGAITGKVSGHGEVNPEALVDISANMFGQITRLAVQEGDPVTKGQLLLELDRAKVEANVQQARAAVQSQRSQVDLARAKAEKAQLDLKRSEDLHKRGLSSDQDLDLARTTARIEEASLAAAQNNYEQAVATLMGAEDDLAKCRYVSPMDGMVSRLNVEEGEMAVTGTMNNPGTVLLSIADLSRMEVEAEVDETDVVDVRVDHKASIKVDAFPDTSFVGHVTEIANTAVTRNRGTQEEVTNFTVKVVFDDRVASLRPGMSATVEIETANESGVVKVPIQAIVSRNPDKEAEALERGQRGKVRNGQSAVAAEADTAQAKPADDAGDEADERDKRVDGVYVLRDGRAVFVPVVTSISDDRFIAAKSGLEASEKVVTGPYQTLRTLESGKRIQEKKEGDGKDRKGGD